MSNAIEIPKIFKQTLPIQKEKKQSEEAIQRLPIAEKSLERLDERTEIAEKENHIHKKKLFEMCEGYSEDEVRIACSVFARKYPTVMFEALSNEHRNLTDLVSGFSSLSSSYFRKANGES